MRRREFRVHLRKCILIMLALSVVACVAGAGSPTADERIRDSSLNPEYVSWRSGFLRIRPEEEALLKGEAPMTVCYRKVFELPAAPREAALVFFMQGRGGYRITANDRTLSEPREGVLQLGALQTFDVTEVLRPGRNVITFSRSCQAWTHSWLSVEGIAHCEDGSTARILTDGWEGGWNLPDGWRNPDAAPEGMGPVEEYNRPLRGAPDNIFRRPYLGPIRVTPADHDSREPMPDPIYDEGKGIRLEVALLNRQQAEPQPVLTAEIFDERNRTALGTETLSLWKDGALDLQGRLELEPLPQGAYRIRFRLTQGEEEVDRRDYEIAVVGQIPQRVVQGTDYKDGLDLKAVWHVNCAAEPKEGTFVASNANFVRRDPELWKELETEIIRSPAGAYRQLVRNGNMDFFSYRYTVQNLFKPHLAVVRWPDDARRSFICHVTEKSSGYPESRRYRYFHNYGYQRAEASVITNNDLLPKRSNRMRDLHLLFWPNAAEGAVTVCNVRGAEKPAAAASMTIYEITNDIPALQVADAGDRWIGYQSERGPWTLASNCYAGPLGPYFLTHLGLRDHPEFLHNWYGTVENWIKAMKFAGQNLYLMGHFMYQGSLYPSELWRHGYNQNAYSGGDVIRDNLPLMLRMFERNEMVMVSNLEHLTVPALVAKQPTPQKIRDGVEHRFMVGRWGTLCPLHSSRHGGSGFSEGDVRWPAVNYFHPENQERLIAFVEEPAKRYGRFPAWKGVCILLSRVFGPMDPALLRDDEPLNWGYEDYTINLFEEETGIDVPVDPETPERFELRCHWIRENVKEEWIEWRCSRYTDLLLRMRDAVRKHRPDAKFYIILGEPMDRGILDGHWDNPEEITRQTLREFGFDLAALRNERRIVVNQTYSVVGSGMTFARGPEDQAWREQTMNQDFQNLFANDNRGGAFIKGSIPHYGNYTFPEDKWLWTSVRNRQGYFWSTFLTETFVNVMARSDPTWMPHTWMDVSQSMGRWHDHRIFARAYRTLPNGDYERLAGNGLDRGIWVSQLEKDGSAWLYAANLHWWAKEVTLRFPERAQVRDLIRNEPVKMVDGAWRFHLDPYSVQTIKVEGARRAVLSAEVEIPGRELRTVLLPETRRLISEHEEMLSRARLREKEMQHLDVWPRVVEFGELLAGMRNALDSERVARAYDLAIDWRTQLRHRELRQKLVEAVPFLVIGPFGDERLTDSDQAAAPPERSAAPLSVPFLNEFAPPLERLGYLAEDFAVVPDRDYAGYDDAEVEWREEWQTGRLRFDTIEAPERHWTVVYAAAEIYCPEKRSGHMEITTDAPAVHGWLNRRLWLHRPLPTDAPPPGERRFAQGGFHLNRGWNTILFKVLYRPGISLKLRMMHTGSRPFQPMTDLLYRLPGSEPDEPDEDPDKEKDDFEIRLPEAGPPAAP